MVGFRLVRFAISFFLFVFFFISASDQVHAKIITVCQQNCPIQKLAQAIALASPYDQIIVQKGLYSSPSITIHKPLSIKGEGFPIIDGLSQGHILHIISKDVKIEGLVLRNSGRSDIEDFAGIYVENSQNCHLYNNRILNTTYGVYLAKTKSCKIEKNLIRGNAKGEVLAGNGIHLWYSSHVKINQNLVYRHRDGLYFEFSNFLSIRKNKSKRNIRYGMHFMFCHDSAFYDNLFFENQTGVAIMYSDRIHVENNRFYKSWNNLSLGLLLKEINHSTFRFNVIKQNTEGIVLDSSAFNTFVFNSIAKNGIAIKIYGNCEGNTFSDNNIIGNFFDVSTNTKENRNTFLGNYWSNYQGYDLDKDGYGDVLYRPVHPFSYLTAKFPELVILLYSPLVEFLSVAEKALPILVPSLLFDAKPRITYKQHDKNKFIK